MIVPSSCRQALRSLAARRGYALLAVITLSFGLAVVSTVFAVVETVLLRALPYAHPERIIAVAQRMPAFRPGPQVDTPGEFLQWQASGLFEQAAALTPTQATLFGQGGAERIEGASVTPDFFGVFGIAPTLGRSFRAGDATPGHDHVVVLSHALWSRRFGANPHIVGQSLQLDGELRTVVGIMPPQFDFPRLADVRTIMNWGPERSEFWVPLGITPKIVEQNNFNYYVLGRLREGVSLQRAAEVFRAGAIRVYHDAVEREPIYRELLGRMLRTYSIDVAPLKDTMSWGVRETLWMLLAAVALLLALVLFNLGSLLLTQNAQRMREYAVRVALGATRWQLFRQGLMEQAVLLSLAAILSFVLTYWGVEMVRVGLGDRLPRWSELSVHPPVFLVVLGLSALTAALFGALPQLVLRDAAQSAAAPGEGRTTTGDRRTSRLRSGLLAAEVGVTLVLLVGAGLLLQSFANVLRVEPGFDARNVLALSVTFNPRTNQKPEQRLQHTREILTALRAIPGVESAAAVSRLPLVGEGEMRGGIHRLGQAPTEVMPVEYRLADDAYFTTMRIPLLRGRLFHPDESSQSALINRQMANRLWPGQDPLGQQFLDDNGPPMTVIGVVGDVHSGSLEQPITMQFYQPVTAQPYYAGTFVLRTRKDPMAVLPLAQQAIAHLDPEQPVSHPQTMERLLASVTLPRRTQTALLTGFATAALALAALGLFGATSLSVAQRRRELGIRLALGARPADVQRQELRRTLNLVAMGLTTGLGVALGLSQLLATLLFEVTPRSWTVYAVAAAVLFASALAATWLPARRAARIDPADALRHE